MSGDHQTVCWDWLAARLLADVDASTNIAPVPNISFAALELASEFDKIESDAQRNAVKKLVEPLARRASTRPADDLGFDRGRPLA